MEKENEDGLKEITRDIDEPEFIDFKHIILFCVFVFIVVSGIVFMLGMTINAVAILYWLSSKPDFNVLSLSIETLSVPSILLIAYAIVSYFYAWYFTIRFLYHQLKKEGLLTSLSHHLAAELWEHREKFQQHIQAKNLTDHTLSIDLRDLLLIQRILQPLPRILIFFIKQLLRGFPLAAFMVSLSDYMKHQLQIKAALQDHLEQVMDELLKDGIGNVMPTWVKFIIPVNIVLLIALFV